VYGPSGEKLDVIDQQEIERVIVAFELIEGLLLIGSDDVGHVLRGVEIAHPRTRVLRENKVADCVNQMGLSQAHATVDEERVVRCAGMFGDLQRGSARELIGFSATKPSKLNSGMRLERSACGDRGGRERATRGAGAGALTGSGELAVSRLSDTRIGDEKNSAPIASMRGTKRSFTHCSTNRLGASKRSSPDGAAKRPV